MERDRISQIKVELTLRNRSSFSDGVGESLIHPEFRYSEFMTGEERRASREFWLALIIAMFTIIFFGALELAMR